MGRFLFLRCRKIMAFTNISTVSGMFPSFQRGGNQPQQPTDALIQQYINDAASLLIAVLTRRFSESIYAVPGNNLSLWAASLGLPNYSWVASSAVAVGVVLVDENTPPGAWKATTAGTSGAGVPRSEEHTSELQS